VHAVTFDLRWKAAVGLPVSGAEQDQGSADD